jgi:hypothetical protein
VLIECWSWPRNGWIGLDVFRAIEGQEEEVLEIMGR